MMRFTPRDFLAEVPAPTLAEQNAAEFVAYAVNRLQELNNNGQAGVWTDEKRLIAAWATDARHVLKRARARFQLRVV